MSEFFESLSGVKQNWNPYKKWDKERDKKEAQRKELHKKVPASKEEIEHAKNYGNMLINAINVMDEYSEDKSQDMELAVQSVAGIPTEIGGIAGMGAGGFLMKKVKNPKQFLFVNPLTMSMLGGVLGFIPASLWGTKVQVWASKVARFQAREKELKDPQNFVIYNTEQLNEAKKIAKTLPKEEEDGILTKMITKNETVEMMATVKSVNEDKKAHKRWYKQYLEEEKQLKASYKDGIPAEKLAKTKADQEIITNTVKKINETAEEYSEDMEAATNTAGTMFSVFGGAIVGVATHFVLKGLEKAKVIAKDGFLNKAKGSVSTYGGFFALIAMQIYFVSLQKDAARVGRHKAKQELMSDPKNFIHYDEKQIESVKDVRAKNAKRGFLTRLISSPMDLFNFVKDKRAYDKYKKTQGKEEKRFREALKQVKPTDEQLTEAKNIQVKVFNSFEKQDQMTEKYSENIEAVTDIANQSLPFVSVLGGSGILYGLASYLEHKVKGKSMGEIQEYLNNKIDKIKNIKIMPERAKNFFVELKKDIFNIPIDALNRKIKKTEGIESPDELVKNLDELSKGINKDSISKIINNADVAKLKDVKVEKGDLLKAAFKKPRILTAVFGIAAPLLLGYVGIIYAIQRFYTAIQKRAGKIGMMKAMQELENPRYFVDKFDNGKTQSAAPAPAIQATQQQIQTQTANNPLAKSWLEKIQQQRTQVSA